VAKIEVKLPLLALCSARPSMDNLWDDWCVYVRNTWQAGRHYWSSSII